MKYTKSIWGWSNPRLRHLKNPCQSSDWATRKQIAEHKEFLNQDIEFAFDHIYVYEILCGHLAIIVLACRVHVKSRDWLLAWEPILLAVLLEKINRESDVGFYPRKKSISYCPFYIVIVGIIWMRLIQLNKKRLQYVFQITKSPSLKNLIIIVYKGTHERSRWLLEDLVDLLGNELLDDGRDNPVSPDLLFNIYPRYSYISTST